MRDHSQMDQEPLRPSRDAWFFTLFIIWVFAREVLGDDSALWRAPAAVLGVAAIWHLAGLIRQERRWRVRRGTKPASLNDDEARAEGV